MSCYPLLLSREKIRGIKAKNPVKFKNPPICNISNIKINVASLLIIPLKAINEKIEKSAAFAQLMNMATICYTDEYNNSVSFALTTSPPTSRISMSTISATPPPIVPTTSPKTTSQLPLRRA